MKKLELSTFTKCANIRKGFYLFLRLLDCYQSTVETKCYYVFQSKERDEDFDFTFVFAFTVISELFQ